MKLLERKPLHVIKWTHLTRATRTTVYPTTQGESVGLVYLGGRDSVDDDCAEWSVESGKNSHPIWPIQAKSNNAAGEAAALTLLCDSKLLFSPVVP